MALAVPNMESYNQQMGIIQAQLAQLKGQPFYNPQPIQQVLPQVKYVDGIAGAKEYQERMPSNSSEIIMDKNEDIFKKEYLL